jgi:hypothetical protein
MTGKRRTTVSFANQKGNHMKFFISMLTLLAAASAHAGQMFELTLTNTSSMPVSGGVVYIISGQGGASEVGQAPSPGFVTLCQTGNSTTKFNELKANSQVSFVMQTPGPVLPGKSVTVQVPYPAAYSDSLHFEAMYGESKEACASISLPSTAFEKVDSMGEVIGKDDVIVAGAATQPAVPLMSSTAYQHICDGAAAAVNCLRLLSSAKTGPQIGYFPGYLPSVLSYLEGKYNAVDVQTLLIPTSGAVHYSLKSN